jgi:hypothetical protein
MEWEYNSVIECLLSLCEALGSILSIEKKKKKGGPGHSSGRVPA